MPEPADFRTMRASAFDDDTDEDDYFARVRRAKRIKRLTAAALMATALLFLGVAGLSSRSAEAPPAAAARAEARSLARVGPPPAAPTLVAPVEEVVVAAPNQPPAEVTQRAKPRRAARAMKQDDEPNVRVFAAPHPVMPKIERIGESPPAPRASPSGPPGTPAPEPAPPPPIERGGNGLARPIALLWTEPGGAAVTVNGRYIGRTPCNVSWDLGGETDVELALPGYETYVMTLSTQSSGLLRVELEPTPQEEEQAADEVEPAPAQTPGEARRPAATPDLRLPEPTPVNQPSMPEPKREPR